MSNVTLRIARVSDAHELLALYVPYVEETAISFETEVPSLEEFTQRMIKRLRNIRISSLSEAASFLAMPTSARLSGALRICGRRRRRYICGATAAKWASAKCCTPRLRALPVLRA